MIEVRDDGGTTPLTLTSYASLFGVAYNIGGKQYGFTEVVQRGAFTKTLASSPDVVFRLEHSGPPLARTTAGTLKLTQDSTGLKYVATLDRSDPDVQSLIPKVRSGAYSESSFAFRCVADSWTNDETQRVMTELDLDRGDVSIVTFGASPTTGKYVELSRSQGSAQERRAMAQAISASHWGGPGADLFRGSPFSNQHGSTCTTCNGTGQSTCASCDGKGWTPWGDAPSGSGQVNGGRSAVVIPPARYDEFEASLSAIAARSKR